MKWKNDCPSSAYDEEIPMSGEDADKVTQQHPSFMRSLLITVILSQIHH